MGFSNFKTTDIFALIVLIIILLLSISVILFILSKPEMFEKPIEFAEGLIFSQRKVLLSFFILISIILFLFIVIMFLVIFFSKDIYNIKLPSPVGELHVMLGSYPSINGIIPGTYEVTNYIQTYPKLYAKFGMRRYLMKDSNIAKGTYSDINWLEDSFLVYDTFSSEPVYLFNFIIPEQDTEFQSCYYEIVGSFYNSRDNNFNLTSPIKELQQVIFAYSEFEGQLKLIETLDPSKNKLISG